MEDYVARAYQVACLTREQVQRIHEVEDRCHYVLPNWNIQEIIGLPSIKERFCMGDEGESLAAHARKVKSEIDVQKLTSTDYGFPTSGNLSAMHSYDWAILGAKDVLPFVGSGVRGGKRSRLEETV